MKEAQDRYRLDKTQFRAMSVEEADAYQRNYKDHSLLERLEIALYLTGMAYNFDINHPPKMDKTIFNIEKLK